LQVGSDGLQPELSRRRHNGQTRDDLVRRDLVLVAPRSDDQSMRLQLAQVVVQLTGCSEVSNGLQVLTGVRAAEQTPDDLQTHGVAERGEYSRPDLPRVLDERRKWSGREYSPRSATP